MHRSVASILLLWLVLSACSAIRFGGEPVPDVGGTWGGSVVVEGQDLQGTLEVVQVESALEATFHAPALGIATEGAGEIDDDGEMWLEVPYDLECPGTARFEGGLSEDGRRLEGTVRASDCTGTVNGTFSFSRR